MAGGDVMNEDFTAAAINSEAGAQAVQFWGDLVATDQVAASTSTGNDPTDERFPTERGGDVRLRLLGLWLDQGQLPRVPAENWTSALIPPPNSGDANATVYGGWTVMAYANTQCPKEAAEFAINLFGAEDLTRNVQWATVLNTKLSPRASVKEAAGDFYTEFPHDFFINEVFPTARPEPSYAPEIAHAVWEALQQAMFNGMSGADATNAAADTINAYLATQ